MEKLVDDGLVEHLRVSNFSVKQVEELLSLVLMYDSAVNNLLG